MQVVGFGSGWHAALTMAQLSSKVHAVRLAQCREVELRLEAQGKVKGEHGQTHMQVDGEPWRQPITAAANVQQRQRPAGLQESGPSTTGGAAGGSGGDGSAAQQAVQQVVVHVAHAGQWEVLFNEADPQGIRRVRNLASRGAQRSSKVPSKFSFLKQQL